MKTNEFPIVTSGDVDSSDTVILNVDGTTSQIPISELYAALALSFGRKTYLVLLTQVGTSAPTAVAQLNSLGSTPVLARTSIGVSTITAAGKFPIGKTRFFPIETDGTFSAIITHVSADIMKIETFNANGDPVDGVLSDHLFELYTS